MNILLNLISIKSGGGQQVAFNYVDIISKNKHGHEWFFLVTKNTPIENRLFQNGFREQIFSIQPYYVTRLIFEKSFVPKMLKSKQIDIIYTLFGPGINKTGVPSVVGSAYSNLYFPEINFWKEWPFYKRIKFWFIDKYRLSKTLSADAWIFENESLRKRALELFGIEKEKSIFIKPSISGHLIKNKIPSNEMLSRIEHISKGFRLLILSGWHKNKRIEIVPDILRLIIDNKPDKEVYFVISVPSNHPDSIKMINKAKRLKVDRYIHFFGPVNTDEVQYVYQNTDATLLLSLLESFSNNIVETWAMGNPLIISKKEWAISICGNSAIYVDRDDPVDIANAILKLSSDKALYDLFRNRGFKALTTYPTPEEKIELQIQFLQKIYDHVSREFPK